MSSVIRPTALTMIYHIWQWCRATTDCSLIVCLSYSVERADTPQSPHSDAKFIYHVQPPVDDANGCYASVIRFCEDARATCRFRRGWADGSVGRTIPCLRPPTNFYGSYAVPEGWVFATEAVLFAKMTACVIDTSISKVLGSQQQPKRDAWGILRCNRTTTSASKHAAA
jgi:hypothetical protein